MYGAVRLACEGQLAAIVQKRSRAGNVQIEIDTAFLQVMGKISMHALRGAYQLLHLQEQNEEGSNICLGLFRSTMGYP